MKAETHKRIQDFVSENIGTFHKARLARILKLTLADILRRKNPYLFRAKNLNAAPDLVASILDAYLSSSEEELFGQFLEELAIFVSGITLDGQKSAAEGLDLELTKGGTRYIIAIKSGPNWGNSSQYKDLRLRFKNAVRVLKQSRRTKHVQPVLGICYGKFKTRNTGEYLKIGGQSFWHLISGDPNLYVDIIEPLGHEAKRHNDAYLAEKDRAYNLFTKQFIDDFCDAVGRIDWRKLVEFNSANLTAATKTRSVGT